MEFDGLGDEGGEQREGLRQTGVGDECEEDAVLQELRPNRAAIPAEQFVEKGGDSAPFGLKARF